MTSLVGGERVFKTDERVEAYGTVDELAAFAALLGDNMRAEAALSPYVDDLNRILSRLMTVEALLACGKTGCGKVAPLAPEAVTWLEGRIDAMQDALKPIDKFTIPGGNAVVSMCHVCRTVCRRAERAALRADEKIRHGCHRADVAEPPFRLFLSARAHAHRALRRRGDLVDSIKLCIPVY